MKNIIIAGLLVLLAACGDVGVTPQPAATTGVTKATAQVQVQANGLTIEQENVKRRLAEDNKPGAVKHLYIISAYSGDVLIYSTVKGKVTSSGKRLTPYTVSSADGQYVGDSFHGFSFDIGGERHRTSEVLQDDGTYGSSVDYIYWWDSKDVYHQHYINGGQIVHISNAPLRVGKIILNLETASQ